jgi:hypothetical protein
MPAAGVWFPTPTGPLPGPYYRSPRSPWNPSLAILS